MPDTSYRRRGRGRHYLLPGGDVHTVLLDGDESQGTLCALEVRCPPGGGPPPHSEPTDAWFRVLEGQIQFQLERDGQLETLLLDAGDTAWVPGGAGHAFKNVGTELARLLVVGRPAGLEEFIAEAGTLIEDGENPPPPPRVHDREEMEALFARHGVEAFQVESAVWSD
jgi:quercetin dioxygenase-like cupin family protein